VPFTEVGSAIENAEADSAIGKMCRIVTSQTDKAITIGNYYSKIMNNMFCSLSPPKRLFWPK
jgi:hypothetical protein